MMEKNQDVDALMSGSCLGNAMSSGFNAGMLYPGWSHPRLLCIMTGLNWQESSYVATLPNLREDIRQLQSTCARDRSFVLVG